MSTLTKSGTLPKFQATSLVQAVKVHRAEGEVWRFNYQHNGVQYRGEKEHQVYTWLRDYLGASGPQAAAVIVAAQADYDANLDAEREAKGWTV
jgi:hypothetical protein